MKQRGLLHLLFLGIVSLSLLAPGVAEAHAAFVRSDPAPGANLDKPPQQVTIWFSQELAKDSGIKVFDKAGQRVDLDNTQVSLADPKSMTVGLRPLSPGAYRVDWESVSLEDGDREEGSFNFTLGGGGDGISTILLVSVGLGIVVVGITMFSIIRLRRRVS